MNDVLNRERVDDTPTTPQNLRANHRMTVFHTTVTPQELTDALYLDPGRTYTIRIVAWGHSAGSNRPSDHSNPLTVTFPNT